MSPDDIVTMDYKIFTMGKKKIAIWVIETTNSWFALDQKDELLTAMKDRKVCDSVDALFVHVVNILTETNTTLVLWEIEQQAIFTLYGEKTHDHLANLGQRISRKKQLVPEFESYFAKL
jgi:manganese-dependent inorganic pyrophosphatase